MDTEAVWAVEQLGPVVLGDKRRTQRAVEMGQAMARRPGDGLVKQMGDWNGQRGAYRLLDNEAVSHEALSAPHWAATRQRSGQSGRVVLMVQDITELDYSGHEATEGLGPIGDHQGRGLLVHNPLAIEPSQRQVIGLAYQQGWVREETVHKGQETRAARQQRTQRQSQRWVKACVGYMWPTGKVTFSPSLRKSKPAARISVCGLSRIAVWPAGARMTLSIYWMPPANCPVGANECSTFRPSRVRRHGPRS